MYKESNIWRRDASYLRLKTLELGYTLPDSILRKSGISNIRFYINGYNLLTFCDSFVKAFDPEKVDLYFESKSGKIHIFGNGVACDYSEEEATKILSDPEVTALVDMHMGEAEATAWGCDLSYDYVKINADYRS